MSTTKCSLGWLGLVGLLGALACSSTTAAPKAPAKAPPPVAAAPPPSPPPVDLASIAPPSGLAPDWKFPAIKDSTLSDGLALRLVERHALPLVQIELVVKTGSAEDGEKPGLAGVAGELLKAGGAGKWNSRALLEAAESLGGNLEVMTDRDSTRITLAVTSDHFAAALDVVGALVTKPRFDGGEFQKLKRREIDRVQSLSRTNAAWVANMVLYRELFQLPTGMHPYSRYDATAHQLEGIRLEDCRGWHKKQVTPKNTLLVIAGDVDQKTATEQAERVFAKWQGEAPEAPTFTDPFPPKAVSIYLVDRPQSPQAEVYVATLGPERRSPEWPALRVTNQILGGGVASRLFLDVREKRSLAYRTRSQVEALAHGPVPIILAAGTQTAKAGLALDALLSHFDGLGKVPASDDEISIATRYLSDVFLVGVDTVSSIAGMTTDLSIFGLPPDYYDTYRVAVREVTREAAFDFAKTYFTPGKAVVVVAGDAARLGKPLSHFGPVHIVDADAGFVTKADVPHDPTAPIELQRIEGT